MILIDDFIENFSQIFHNQKNLQPWEITKNLTAIIQQMIPQFDDRFNINNGIAIHKTAKIENGAVLKAPVIIGENCFIAATAYLRGGIYLGHSSVIGPGCEVKTCIILHNSAIAHLNFVADSIIGNDVNFEAGSLTANHYNERVWKEIDVVYQSELIRTDCTRFGSLIGDHCRIGANAVLFPGTMLSPNSIVNRLTLVNQLSTFRN